YISDYDGDISSCCLEFSSLERVLYNMINNAAEHTADGRARLFVTTLGSEKEENVKFAVANRVKREELKQLRARFGEDLTPLFDGGFTIGGTGVGLSVVSQIVANAYGLEHARGAAAGGYVGASLEDGEFLVWAHWPTTEGYSAISLR
ncbi:MAG: ATP-binding protein, partial [Alkalispirochaetaceae bacterium]